PLPVAVRQLTARKPVARRVGRGHPGATRLVVGSERAARPPRTRGGMTCTGPSRVRPRTTDPSPPGAPPLTQHTPTGDLDPFFVFEFRPIDEPDEHDPDRRPSTYWDLERGCRGPHPLPDWVVTDRGAVDTDLGTIKTGKAADVPLVRREATDGSGHTTLMAAKRYRDDRHRSFHRSAAYTESRRARRSRDTRALDRKSSYGRQVAASMWAQAEWQALCRYWEAGVAVPYPVQVDGPEILMEFVADAALAAPPLAPTRPDPHPLGRPVGQVPGATVP